MSRFRDVFTNRHVILPVVHVESEEQARRNSELAADAGCDGVFLINHFSDHEHLLSIHAAVARSMPGYWVGVNCLGLHPGRVFEVVTPAVGGVWADNAEIDERTQEQPAAEKIAAARQASGWDGLYFGGVAFKYQRSVEELERAASLVASGYMDVVTTSGPGTGLAAERDKITRLRSRLGARPLAIASGITPENVADYLDVADCFLVATGISRSFTELDPARTAELVKRVRG